MVAQIVTLLELGKSFAEVAQDMESSKDKSGPGKRSQSNLNLAMVFEGATTPK